MALELIKTLILDAQSETLFTGAPRRLAYEAVPGKAFVCMGVRRSGKSTFLNQVMTNLLARGVPRENVLYLNFFDERLATVCQGQPGLTLDAYYSLFPGKKGRERIYCFFDEIQEVSGWEPFVSRLLRTENCEVYLTGSSARLLSREIATQMRGRALAWELFPFSFREFLDARGVSVEPLTSANQYAIRHAWDEYWQAGGFPEVLDVSPKLRVMTHQEYLRTIVLRDVVERNDAVHPQAVAHLAARLTGSVGSLHSLNRLTGGLKSAGFRASKLFVGECIQWFEDAFFLFPVPILASSANRQNANPRKIYCVDHALVASVSPSLSADQGHLLENLVFMHLRRTTSRIYYHRTRTGRELDLVWRERNGALHAVQVCLSLQNEETRRRELKALAEGMHELDLAEATLVTLNDEEELDLNPGRVRIVPAWRFLLDDAGKE